MSTQRCSALVTAGTGGRAVVVVPFDPDEVSPGGGGWAFTVGQARALELGAVIGGEVLVELTPEGPQRADLAEDIAAALAANPAAAAFFDTLAQFYRKAYLRYIDATTRRPDVRAARIVEVVELLAAGVKERPRS